MNAEEENRLARIVQEGFPVTERPYQSLADTMAVSESEILRIMEDWRDSGRLREISAVMKGGDPYIYGRGGEEVEYLHSRGIECDVVSGVTAASGVAASLLLPLTHRDCASSLRFHSAHRKRDEPLADFGDLTTDGMSHVFYMGGTRLKEIRDAFFRFDMGSLCTPVAVVRRGTLPDQSQWVGTLAKIEEHDLDLLPGDPVLVIVGEVVTHSIKAARPVLESISVGRSAV